MYFIKAIATKLIYDSSYPEFVLCEFFDIKGKKYEFIEKWPVVSNKPFINEFPMECVIGCTIVKEHAESYIVNTLEPWHIESKEGFYEFEVCKSLIINS